MKSSSLTSYLVLSWSFFFEWRTYRTSAFSHSGKGNKDSLMTGHYKDKLLSRNLSNKDHWWDKIGQVDILPVLFVLTKSFMARISAWTKREHIFTNWEKFLISKATHGLAICQIIKHSPSKSACKNLFKGYIMLSLNWLASTWWMELNWEREIYPLWFRYYIMFTDILPLFLTSKSFQFTRVWLQASWRTRQTIAQYISCDNLR